MSKHINIVNEEEFNELLKGPMPVICDFFATWCNPCRMLAPVLEELAEEYEGKAVFVKVDVDQCESLARQYGIHAIPNVRLFKDGESAGESQGFLPKQAMKEFIDANL